ncbi:MAG: hypothetical protein ABI053_03080 [Lacisediminihabitans sp.]
MSDGDPSPGHRGREAPDIKATVTGPWMVSLISTSDFVIARPDLFAPK